MTHILFLALTDSHGDVFVINPNFIESFVSNANGRIEITMQSGRKFQCKQNIEEISKIMQQTVEYHYGG